MKKYDFFCALKDLFKYSKDLRKQYLIGIFFMIVFVVTTMIYTTMNSNLVANIMSFQLDKAAVLVLICALLRIFSITFCHNRYRRIVIRTGEEISSMIQKKIYQKVLDLTMNSYDHINSGMIYTTIKAADSSMMSTISTLFQESAYIATSCMMLIIVYIIDYKIGLVVTTIVVSSLYLFKIQLSQSKKYLDQEFHDSDNYSTLISETTKGVQEIKSLDLKQKCLSLFTGYIDHLKDVRTKRRLLGKNVNTAKWTIRTIGDGIILLYIINNVRMKVFDVETAMLIITYMTTIIDDVYHRIIEHDFGISEFTANMKRIKWLLEDTKLQKEMYGEKICVDIQGSIEFINLNFKYNGQQNETLHNVNFKVHPHTKTAIIGMSGGGKSTIFKLLLRYYDHYDGNILIDNINIKDFSEKSLRNAITIVNQEPILFNMSIKDNLLMINDKATFDDIKKACKLANIDTFIESLPHQYDEIIEENTTNISVGQKQRIAIARAILKNTPIILLDEVTSALDKKSKKEIEKTIEELSKYKTIIVIVHTLDNIKNYDKIIVVKDGYIVEEGNEMELLNKKGMYYKLKNL